MKFQPHLLSAGLIALSTLSTNAMSHEHKQEQEHRAHGSHEHGAAQLDIVLAGNELAFEWRSPAANLLGFEHQAKTEAQKQQVSQVNALLSKANSIIDLPESAGCTLASSQINSDILKPSSEHHEEHEHEEHEHEHEHEEKHADDHAHEHEEKHADTHEHEHEEKHHDEHEHEEHGSAHADISVSYLFNCSNPSAITKLPVTLFQHFPLTEKVQVQGIINDQQMATSLTPENNNITW